MAYSEQIKNILIQTLDEMQWKYGVKEIEDDLILHTGLMLGEDDKIARIMYFFDVSENELIIKTYCDVKADEKNKEKMSEYICRANWGLKNGNFEFDYEQGTVRYKVYIKVLNREIDTKEIISAIVLSAKMWSKYGNGIVDILGSDKEPKDVICEIEEPES